MLKSITQVNNLNLLTLFTFFTTNTEVHANFTFIESEPNVGELEPNIQKIKVINTKPLTNSL